MLRKFFGDIILWIIILVLSLFSILVVYSSTGATAGDLFWKKALDQFLFVLVSFVIIWGISKLMRPFWIIEKARVWVIFCLVLSLLALTPGIGVEINGARRWLEIPHIITFCPFDFLRLAVMIDLVSQLSKRADVIGKMKILPDFWRWDRRSREISHDIIKTVTIPIFWPTVLSICLIAYSNVSTAALILTPVVIIILWFGNIHKREMLKVIFLVVFFGGIMLGTMVIFNIGRGETVKARIAGMFSKAESTQVESESASAFRSSDDITREVNNLPKADYQKEMAKIAVASGGFWGKGAGNSTLRTQLPHAYDDCVYAFIIEEYGLFFGLIVLFAYFAMLIRGGVIARRSRYYSFSLLSIAIVVHIFITAVVHMLVSVGFFVTGQTLPLISKGGSSLFANAFALGILLGISAYSPRDTKPVEICPECDTEKEEEIAMEENILKEEDA